MLPRLSLLISAALAAICVTATARAQAPLAPTANATASSSPPPAATIDSRPGIGAVAAIGGAVMGIGGAVLFATAPAPRPLPLHYADDPPMSGARFGGAGLMGGGIALAALGLPLYLATSGAPSKPHRSESRMVTGVVLTTIGVALLGAGTGLFLDGFTVRSNEGYNYVLVGAFFEGPMLLTGTIATSVGIPLWVTGASPPAGSAARQPAVTRPEVSLGPRSVGLRFRF